MKQSKCEKNWCVRVLTTVLAPQVLNFEDIPPKSSDEISLRAKTIFDINAPSTEKEGGSPYLQAKVYWARIRLEHAVKHGEIAVAKADEAPVDESDASAAEPQQQNNKNNKQE
jgi:hypothetical protein